MTTRKMKKGDGRTVHHCGGIQDKIHLKYYAMVGLKGEESERV
jgi:hypothetical protein